MVGWSPDGTRLLFKSDRSGSTDLWALEFAGGKPRGSPELIKRDLRGFTLGMTASGSLYTQVFPGAQSDIQVASFDFAKGQFLSMPTPVVDTFVGTNGAPSWSPDGKYLAYVSRRQPCCEGDPVIGIRTIETGRVRELSARLARLRAFSVAWLPDGVSFMATGRDFKGHGGIHKIDGQTGQVSLIVSARSYAVFSSPVLSPDGKTLYYGLRIDLSGATEYVLMKRDLASATETELLRRPVLGTVSLSPDGLYLATASGDPSTKSNTFLIIPTAGGEPKEVMRRAPPQQPGLFVWGPDSQSLLIRIGSGGDKLELWRAFVDGTPAVKLDTMVDRALGFVRLHPDGRQIAFEVRTPTKPTEIWVTENFLSARKGTK
jgi:Tol biopolymer transport system component